MTPPGGEAPEGGWQSLKVPELQEELEARGLPKSGKKADLVARLEEDDQGGGEAEAPEAERPPPTSPLPTSLRPIPNSLPRSAGAARPRPAAPAGARLAGPPTARSWSGRALATCAPLRARRDS